MKNRLLNLVAAGSLILSTMAVALWVRSYSSEDLAIAGVRPTQYELSSAMGELQLLMVSGPIAFGRPEGRNVWSQTVQRPTHISAWRPTVEQKIRFMGLQIYSGDFAGAQAQFPLPYHAVIVPYWVILLAFFAIPSMVIFRSCRKRLELSCCANCGYDLRATPDRCPECGTVPRTIPISR